MHAQPGMAPQFAQPQANTAQVHKRAMKTLHDAAGRRWEKPALRRQTEEAQQPARAAHLKR